MCVCMHAFGCVHLCVWKKFHSLIFFEIWWTFHPTHSLSLIPQPVAFTQPFSTLLNAALLFCFSIHRHRYTNFIAPPPTWTHQMSPSGFDKGPPPLSDCPQIRFIDTNSPKHQVFTPHTARFENCLCEIYTLIWIYTVSDYHHWT